MAQASDGRPSTPGRVEGSRPGDWRAAGPSVGSPPREERQPRHLVGVAVLALAAVVLMVLLALGVVAGLHLWFDEPGGTAGSTSTTGP